MDEIGAKTKKLGAKQYEKDLFAINYRSQGVAEKIPETQGTVLAKDKRSGLDLQKVAGWIWMQRI
jgi:hypothetical protein